jgi:hypothetical protein
MRTLRSEGGWGLLIVLLALAIVAFLARDAPTAYLGGVVRPATPAPSRGAQDPPREAAPSEPSMQRPVERARGVEDTVARGTEARAKALEERGR